MSVFAAITGNWWKIKSQCGDSSRVYTTVPDARAALIRKKFSQHDQVTAEAGKYYALYHHDPSWKELSVNLYRAGETTALGIAKPHVQTVTGMCYVFFCSSRNTVLYLDLCLPLDLLG